MFAGEHEIMIPGLTLMGFYIAKMLSHVLLMMIVLICGPFQIANFNQIKSDIAILNLLELKQLH